MIFGSGKKVLDLANAHYEKVTECYESFCEFMRAYYEPDNDARIYACFEKLDRFEREADELRFQVVDCLLTGTLLPGTRKEILDLSAKVDKIANRAQDIARQMVIEGVELPAEFCEDLLLIVQYTWEQLDCLTSIIEMLFANYEKLVKDHSLIDKVRDYESKVDKLENGMIERAFKMDIPLAEKNHYRYFIRHIANVSDHIENIVDDIQIMMVYRKV